MKKFMGYPVVEDNGVFFVGAPCGCPDCDRGARPGHEFCDPSPEDLLRAEEEGALVRSLFDGSWRWVLTKPSA